MPNAIPLATETVDHHHQQHQLTDGEVAGDDAADDLPPPTTAAPTKVNDVSSQRPRRTISATEEMESVPTCGPITLPMNDVVRGANGAPSEPPRRSSSKALSASGISNPYSGSNSLASGSLSSTLKFKYEDIYGESDDEPLPSGYTSWKRGSSGGELAAPCSTLGGDDAVPTFAGDKKPRSRRISNCSEAGSMFSVDVIQGSRNSVLSSRSNGSLDRSTRSHDSNRSVKSDGDAKEENRTKQQQESEPAWRLFPAVDTLKQLPMFRRRSDEMDRRLKIGSAATTTTGAQHQRRATTTTQSSPAERAERSPSWNPFERKQKQQAAKEDIANTKAKSNDGDEATISGDDSSSPSSPPLHFLASQLTCDTQVPTFKGSYSSVDSSPRKERRSKKKHGKQKQRDKDNQCDFSNTSKSSRDLSKQSTADGESVNGSPQKSPLNSLANLSGKEVERKRRRDRRKRQKEKYNELGKDVEENANHGDEVSQQSDQDIKDPQDSHSFLLKDIYHMPHLKTDNSGGTAIMTQSPQSLSLSMEFTALPPVTEGSAGALAESEIEGDQVADSYIGEVKTNSRDNSDAEQDLEAPESIPLLCENDNDVSSDVNGHITTNAADSGQSPRGNRNEANIFVVQTKTASSENLLEDFNSSIEWGDGDKEVCSSYDEEASCSAGQKEDESFSPSKEEEEDESSDASSQKIRPSMFNDFNLASERDSFVRRMGPDADYRDPSLNGTVDWPSPVSSIGEPEALVQLRRIKVLSIDKSSSEDVDKEELTDEEKSVTEKPVDDNDAAGINFVTNNGIPSKHPAKVEILETDEVLLEPHQVKILHQEIQSPAVGEGGEEEKPRSRRLSKASARGNTYPRRATNQSVDSAVSSLDSLASPIDRARAKQLAIARNRGVALKKMKSESSLSSPDSIQRDEKDELEVEGKAAKAISPGADENDKQSSHNEEHTNIRQLKQSTNKESRNVNDDNDDGGETKASLDIENFSEASPERPQVQRGNSWKARTSGGEELFQSSGFIDDPNAFERSSKTIGSLYSKSSAYYSSDGIDYIDPAATDTGKDDFDFAMDSFGVAINHGHFDCHEKFIKNINMEEDNDHVLAAKAYMGLGFARQCRGELESSLDAYTKALQLWEMELGNDHSGVSCVHYTIGTVLNETQSQQEASVHFKHALRLLNSKSTGERGVKASILCTEGMLSSVTGDAQRAIDCFRQALLIYQNSDEPLDLKFATVMFEMGTLLSQRNEYKDAANCYKFALEIRKNKLQDSFIVARTHYSLGVTLASQELRANITAAASSHLEEALRICQKECGKDNYQAAIIIHAMGVLDERKGDFNAASVWFTMELNMRKVLSGHGAFLVTKAMSRDVFRDTSTHVFDSSRRSF